MEIQRLIYLVLGICFGIIIQTALVYVDAQTVYCDKELYIFLINNDLEGLIGCINAPDITQDTQLEVLDNRVDVIENRTGITTNQTR